jgi:hypothetical protein
MYAAWCSSRDHAAGAIVYVSGSIASLASGQAMAAAMAVISTFQSR